jgi:hypothetical protein
MTNPIVRMYETEEQARGAVDKLREEGFPEDRIFLVTPAAGGEEGSAEAIANAIMAGYILRSHAKVYAQGIVAGRSLALIHPPFGYGMLATQILDSYGPMDSGLEVPPKPLPKWDEAAPLSSAILAPTVIRNAPAPFSAMLGLSPLKTGRSVFSSIFGELASPNYAVFGASRLSHQAAPLSSMFGLKILSTQPGGAAWTRSLGLPMLSADPAPFSSWLGLHALTPKLPRHHPAPFSAHLGLPTLSRGRSWMSRIFGELTSPSFAVFGSDPLIASPTPFSSRFGLGVLSHQGGPSWTKSFGLPLLTKGGKPSWFAPARLAKHPAPFSAALGLPVLSIIR